MTEATEMNAKIRTNTRAAKVDIKIDGEGNLKNLNQASSTIYDKKVRVLDRFLQGLIYLAASISILILVGIMGYVFVRGISQINWQFLSTVQSARKGTFGILGNIVNTVYIVVVTLLVVTPIGIGSAIYLNEYAKPGKIVNMIVSTTEILSGIPSIIFGLFGMVFFGNVLKLGYSVLTGSFTLMLMVLPLITRNTQEALKTVPDSYRQGALGMGASKWHMIRMILLPSAMPGILTGVILSVGRIVGESAALLFTAGSGFQLPRSLFSKLFESSGTLTIQLYLSMQKAKYDQAFGIALVLLVLVLGINLLTHWITKRFGTERVQ